jgi:hypothetical protein
MDVFDFKYPFIIICAVAAARVSWTESADFYLM